MNNDLISKNWSDAQWFNFICGLVKEPQKSSLDLLKLKCFGFTGFKIPKVKASGLNVTVDIELKNSSKYKYKNVEYPWIINGASLAFVFDTNILEVKEIAIPDENPLQNHIVVDYDNQMGYVNIYDINEPDEIALEQDTVVFSSIKFRVFNRYASSYGRTPLLCMLCEYPNNYMFQDVIENTCQCLTYHVANYNNAANDIYYAMPTTNISGEIYWGYDENGNPLPGRQHYTGTWHLPFVGLGGISAGSGIMGGGGSIDYSDGGWTYTPSETDILNKRPGTGLAGPDGNNLDPTVPSQPTQPPTKPSPDQKDDDFWFAKVDKQKDKSSHGSDIWLPNNIPVNGTTITIDLGTNDATKSVMLGEVEVPLTTATTIRDKDGNLLDPSTLDELPEGTKIRLPDGIIITLYQSKKLKDTETHDNKFKITFGKGTIVTLADKTTYIVPSLLPPIIPGKTTVTLVDYNTSVFPNLIRDKIKDIIDIISKKFFASDTLYVWDFVSCKLNGEVIRHHIEEVLCDDLYITDFVKTLLWHVPQSVEELAKANDSFYIRDFILTNKYIAPVIDVITDNSRNEFYVSDFTETSLYKRKVIIPVYDTTIDVSYVRDFVKYKLNGEEPREPIHYDFTFIDSLFVDDISATLGSAYLSTVLERISVKDSYFSIYLGDNILEIKTDEEGVFIEGIRVKDSVIDTTYQESKVPLDFDSIRIDDSHFSMQLGDENRVEQDMDKDFHKDYFKATDKWSQEYKSGSKSASDKTGISEVFEIEIERG